MIKEYELARLIPRVAIEEIQVKPERDTAKYLVEQLSDECIIYHSYPWLKTDRNDKGNTTVKEGETDFVVIIPTHGMLVLEVKGGEITYDEVTRGWNRVLGSGRLKPITDPFEQANRNTHYLENAIKMKGYQGAKRLPFTYGYAVVFPDCEYTGPTPPGSEPAIIFSASDLPYLDRRITAALNQWTRGSQPKSLTTEDVNKIQKSISPAFDLLPVLFRKLEEQEEKLFRLTSDQKSLLTLLGQQSRVCIEGVAGSGKTMLAQAQAEKFADSGKTTLLVCYNKTLAQWISDSISEEYKDLITVKHFHGLCADWVRRAGMPFVSPGQNVNKFWQDQAPELFMDAIDMVSEKFDAVIIDEGQDFLPNWWLPLEAINTDSGQGAMYVFYDPRQNLYVNQQGSLPALGKPYPLPTNCRNTRSIAAKCSDILDIQIATKKDAPIGEKPEVLTIELESDIVKRVEEIIDEWIKKGKLEQSQVAILCPTKKHLSSLCNTKSLKGIELINDIKNWKEAKGILFSTVKSFKGLEADAVILIDVPPFNDGSYFRLSDFYVACSRAKHLLVVIHKEEK